MKRAVWALVALSLIANVVLGAISFNHYRWLGEVEGDVATAESQTEQQLGSIRNLAAEIDEIRSSGFDPAGLEKQIANLRGDVRFLEGSDDDLFQLIEDLAGIGSFGGGTGSPDASIDPSTIEKPISCSSGDVVVWDTFGGLDC